jgi:tetratricopeptide (TPR) repeat protein
MSEWFRRETWSTADAEDFDRRLLRARPHNRAQYLRIQAVHLAEAQPPLHRAALSLLDLVISEYPVPMQLAQAHSQRGECLAALEQPDAAIAAFHQAMVQERAYPQVRTAAYLLFAYFVATHGLGEFFVEARQVLAEFGTDEVFPSQHFYHNAALALIASQTGDHKTAELCARRALEAAGRTTSPFPRHPTFGLVDRPDPKVLGRLTTLAAG